MGDRFALINMVALKIIFNIIIFLMVGYSILRYYFLWKRTKAPQEIFFVINILFLLVFFICNLKTQWLYLIIPYDKDIFIHILQAISSIYINIMIYSAIFCFIRGIIRFIEKKFIYKDKNKEKTKFYRFINHPSKTIYIFLVLSCVIGIFSFANAKLIKTNSYNLNTTKNISENIKLALLSNLHIGSGLTKSDFDNLYLRLQVESPDIIIFNGDLFDNNTPKELMNYTIKKIKDLSPSYGKYFIEGNKDYIDKSQKLDWFKNMGITNLQDQMTNIANGMSIYGLRENSNPDKKNPKELLKNIDKNRFNILVSHNSLELDDLNEFEPDLVIDNIELLEKYSLDLLPFLNILDREYGYNKSGNINHIRSSKTAMDKTPNKLIFPSELILINISKES